MGDQRTEAMMRNNRTFRERMTADSFTVKVWYVSGAFEQILGASAETVVPVYAEAQTSDRIAAAEVHDAAGRVVQSFDRRPVDAPVNVD